ncbi:polysaccharide pyruvyl transferase family protein [Pseudophaeobacter sp.]|uniref:polysaccharide pyruvyl transferase family protein n=1 Tax=Pseudophaeobacter sp. TaxID=1971739 RepID=UPI0032D94D50
MPELRNPIVLGVKTQEAAQALSVERMLQRTGQNTGNILFSAATSSLFDNGIDTDYALPNPWVAKRGDCIVIAAANWLNNHADFGHIADKLEATNLPIIALGLGAQSSLDKQMPKLKPGTQRLISLLAERSPLISARGTFSCEVLEQYGAKNAVPTGCPSLLMQGETAPKFRTRDSSAALQPGEISLHSTRHHFHKAANPFYTYLYQQALLNRHDLLLQSELADFYYTMGRLNNPEIKEKAASLLSEVYQATPYKLGTYLRQHGHVYFSLETWLEYCRTKAFFLGTRIHGTIAAVLAGTPSLLIAHDSRTVEMSEAMAIPYMRKDEIDMDAPLRAEEYYERALDHDFEAAYRRYWEGFRDFFERCGLQTNLYGTKTPETV